MADLARRAGLLSGWVLAGLLVWGMGVFALGRATEDHCLSVAADRGYGAYSQTASVFPPRFTCRLTAPDRSASPERLDLEQWGTALVRSGWLLLLPPVGVAVGGVAAARRGRTSAPDTPTRKAESQGDLP
jgi:hypothetical protein